MKKLLLSAITVIGLINLVQAQQTFTVTSSGFQFVPAALTISAGDTVLFNQSASHPVVEVDQTTWNANGNTPKPGGFSAAQGTKIKFSIPGTYYYVCNVHFSSGMKGQIIVNPLSVEEESANVSLTAYPSPVISDLNLVLELEKAESLSVSVYNIIGEQVFSKTAANYTSGKTILSIDFSEFSSGAYFVKVIGKEEQYTLKILK